MIILVLVMLVSAAICYAIARKKQANALFWLTMGLLVGPLAIPFVLFAKP